MGVVSKMKKLSQNGELFLLSLYFYQGQYLSSE